MPRSCNQTNEICEATADALADNLLILFGVLQACGHTAQWTPVYLLRNAITKTGELRT